MGDASKKAVIDLRHLCNCARFVLAGLCFRENR